MNAALRRMGYAKNEMTGHGFRSMASTLLNEQGWHPDAIERQRSHCEENDVRAAYNYAEYLPQRREMMQAWGDYLDVLRAGRVSRSGTESANERVPLGHSYGQVEARSGTGAEWV